MKKFLTKKNLILFAVSLPIVLVLISGFRTNPPIQRTIKWDSPTTKKLFYKACANCHSNETKWPWYAYVAPASWLVIHNVNEGREEFNISSKHLGEADEAAEKVEKGKMPPSDYLLLHPEAKLTKSEKQMLIAGLKKTFGEEKEHEGKKKGGKKGKSGKKKHDDDDD